MTVSNTGITSRDLTRVGLFPLPNVVLFPAQSLSLHVFEARYRRLIADAIANDLVLAIPRLTPGHDAEYYGAPPVLQVCGVGKVSEYVRLPDGRYNIVVQGLGRVRLVEELRSQSYRMARAEPLPDLEPKDQLTVETLRTELSKRLQRAAPHLPSSAADLRKRLESEETAGVVADIVAGTLVENPDDRQALLEERDPCRRMSWLIAHLHALGAKAMGSSVSSAERPN